MKSPLPFLLFLLVLLAPFAAADPLPSWNSGPAKQAILDFVANVTDPDSKEFVPVPDVN
jgi:hypothetical protein